MFRPTTSTSTVMLRIAAAAVAVSLLTLEDVQADRPELGFRKEPHPSHDCLHNNPKWTPADAPPAEQRWRLKIYVMPNDPAALLARMAEDFPESTRLKDQVK